MENNKAIAIRYNKDYYVTQANILVRSKQDPLTLLEAKLIRLAIAQVVKEDTDLKTYSCKAADLADFLGISRSNVYRDIQNMSKSIMKKAIFMRDEMDRGQKGKENYKIFHWVDYIEYKNGTLTFKLSDGLKPYLVGLDKFFAMYGYDNLLELPSYQTLRLFELLASYQNMIYIPGDTPNYTEIPIEKNEIIFTIDWLREFFNEDATYARERDLVRRIIEPSLKVINETTLMQVTYRIARTNRKISHIIFKFEEWSSEKANALLEKWKKEQKL